MPGDPPLRCSARPRALAGVLPKDLRMAAGDHRLLNIHPVDEMLPDNRQSQELFRYVQCGHSENADVNAAKNILLSATG